jgi:hypothetical protein
LRALLFAPHLGAQERSRLAKFGRRSLEEVKAILSEMGLTFGMQLEDLPSRADFGRESIERAQDIW